MANNNVISKIHAADKLKEETSIKSIEDLSNLTHDGLRSVLPDEPGSKHRVSKATTQCITTENVPDAACTRISILKALVDPSTAVAPPPTIHASPGQSSTAKTSMNCGPTFSWIRIMLKMTVMVAFISAANLLISDQSIFRSNNYTKSSSSKLEYQVSIEQYRNSRDDNFDSWFQNGTDILKLDADKDGPILDFIIAGFAKCGTTSMENNLADLTPMPTSSDICTPVHQTVYYAYKNWRKKYGEEKPLRGSKCPQYIDVFGLPSFSQHLPRTKIIIGIRHPVLWFESFWNMQKFFGKYQDGTTPYNKTQPCKKIFQCWDGNGCPNRELFCLHRGRFHISLAQLGKTALSITERKLLAPNDLDGGANVRNQHIRNPVFLYEQSELRKDYVWDDLAEYLDVRKFPHDTIQGLHNKTAEYHDDFCEEKYDDFRAMMMPHAYNLSMWLQDYFIPVARNESSSVTIPNIDLFTDVVENYKKDPCHRLYRLSNGTYIFNKNRTNIDERI